MTDALKIIKDELARINLSNTEVGWNLKIIDIDDDVARLSKAMSVAVEALKHYDHQKIKATKTPCGTGEMHPLATDALKSIANILSGSKDGK